MTRTVYGAFLTERPSPTGRLSRSEPEIQNLPGTPAAALEKAYARGYADGYRRGVGDEKSKDSKWHGTGQPVDYPNDSWGGNRS